MTFQDLLMREGEEISKAKGEHVFMQGEKDQSFYFVKSGLLKAYYSSEDGKESIKSFIFPDNIIGSLVGSLETRLSISNNSFSLICLEEAHLIRISFTTILEYTKKDLSIANSVIELLLQLAMKKEMREFDLLTLSAEDRYRKLINEQTSLLTKVTQNDLASYLGITPVGLSRIKKRVEGAS